MATQSVQDIDSFIRLQKEKLSRDKFAGARGGYQPPLGDYNQQLDQYMNLPRNPIPMDNQFGPEAQFFSGSGSLQQFQPPVQQQQAPPPQNRQFKENNPPKNDNGHEFFGKFGNYDAHKSKLNKDLHNEYNEYLQQKNGNNRRNNNNRQQTSDDYYATLPLKGMESSKERAKIQRNIEYQILQNKLENSEKSKRIEWWKDKNEPDIKPYSKPTGSQEELPYSTPLSNNSRSRSMNQINQAPDVIADRRLQYNSPRRNEQQPPASNIGDYYRRNSADSLENLRQMQMYQQPPAPIEAWRTPVPPVSSSDIDPSLADILRRPPVGLKTPVPPPRVQFNDNVRYNSYSPPPPQMQQNPYQQQQIPPQAYNDQYRNNPITGQQQQSNGGPFGFSEEAMNKDSKEFKQKQYQEELQRQVREKQMKKQREKEEKERADRKMLEEAVTYNPYGRAGGGAPIKDREGNTIADLSQVRADPDQYSPRSLPGNPNQVQNPFSYNTNSRPGSNDMLNFMMSQQMPHQQQSSVLNIGGGAGGTTNRQVNEDSPFARGGNGIFGEGKTETQKKAQEKYQSELQKQIEDKARAKAAEKEKQRLEDEKEYKRIMEQQERIKAELDEELRKKKAKEEHGNRLADEAKRAADEKRKEAKAGNSTNKRTVTKPVNKKFQRNNVNQSSADVNQFESNADLGAAPAVEFRSNSPPVPAAAKKLNGAGGGGGAKTPAKKSMNSEFNSPRPPSRPKQSEIPADYFVTESRLNVNSPQFKNENKKVEINEPNNDRPPTNLITDYNNNDYKPKPNLSNKTNNNSSIPTKPMIKKSNVTRPVSQVSNSEVLSQLQNLKKHLHNEQMQVENELNNANNRTTVGQLSDLHHNILNVKTPPGDRPRNGPFEFSQRTYRKDLDTPPLNGGLEPRTYFRDHTVLLGDQKIYDDPFLNNDLQRQAHERQLNRINALSNMQNDPVDRTYNYTSSNDPSLSARNQQRLRKLRDLEDDNLSLADPNDVLNKFLNRNNRQPSAGTIHDDTWLKQPA